MSDQKTTKRKRDKSTKRKSIIDAAIRVFLEEGFENASMDRISEEAIASKRTVYNHFSSKQDLFRAVLDQFDGEMRSLKNVHYDKRRTLEEQLNEFADIEISIAQNPIWMGLIRLLLSVFTRYPDIAKEAMSKHTMSESGLTTWMRAATRDGKLSTNDPVLVSRVFSSMLGGAFTWPAVYQGENIDSTTLELKQEIIGAFLARYGKDVNT